MQFLFPERLKELRIKNNLTQKELAIKLGVRQSNISAWELGNRIPLANTLIVIAEFFNCTSDYLLGLQEKK